MAGAARVAAAASSAMPLGPGTARQCPWQHEPWRGAAGGWTLPARCQLRRRRTPGLPEQPGALDTRLVLRVAAPARAVAGCAGLAGRCQLGSVALPSFALDSLLLRVAPALTSTNAMGR